MKKITRRRFLKWSVRIGGLGLVASYPVFIERYVVFTNTYRIPVPRLPEVFSGFRIVQLTDLMISGHTHGGQVDIPFVGTPVLPVRNKNYSSGLKQSPRGTDVFISRGIGWSVYPVRFNCFPEIAILELVPAKDSDGKVAKKRRVGRAERVPPFSRRICLVGLAPLGPSYI